MKVELIELQPKLEEAKVENASMMKVELYKYSFVAFNVRMCLISLMCDFEKVGVELRFLSSLQFAEVSSILKLVIYVHSLRIEIKFLSLYKMHSQDIQ